MFEECFGLQQFRRTEYPPRIVKVAEAFYLIGYLSVAATAVEAAGEQAAPNPVARVEHRNTAESSNQPRTLAELLAVSPDQLDKVDIARMNLLCAEGLRGSEGLNLESCFTTLDAWTRHVERETKRNFDHFLRRPEEFNGSIAYYQMGMLGTVLAEDLRIQYNPERERQSLEKPVDSRVEDWSVFFSNSSDVFIHGLLGGKRQGTCASMPFIYAAIGRRLGYPVTIAARKFHLYVRYETGNGEHLNVEATENRGFATPTDEEYRNGPYPMTKEEIEGCGWLRPLSNKEILGICLVNRANCLRSQKQYDQEIKMLEHAARYLPDTPLMRRVIQKNQQLARNLHAAERWDELWTEIENLHLPTAGPMSEHFRNRKLQVQLFMNQSTNLAEIEKFAARLKGDLREYRNEISDDPAKLAAAFDFPESRANQGKFLALLQDGFSFRRIRLPQEKIPHEYWNGIPAELQSRLNKLMGEQEIVEEMHVYYAEEISLRNVEAMMGLSQGPVLVAPTALGQRRAAKIRPEEVPFHWRGRPIPPELQEDLASLSKISDATMRRHEINRFFRLEDQRQAALEAVRARRMVLNQLPAMQSPVQIEIVPSAAPNEAAPAVPNSALTPSLDGSIRPTTTRTAKP